MNIEMGNAYIHDPGDPEPIEDQDEWRLRIYKHRFISAPWGYPATMNGWRVKKGYYVSCLCGIDHGFWNLALINGHVPNQEEYLGIKRKRDGKTPIRFPSLHFAESYVGHMMRKNPGKVNVTWKIFRFDGWRWIPIKTWELAGPITRIAINNEK